MERRTVIATTGLALSTPLVGCLGSAPGGEENGSTSDDADNRNGSESIEAWEYDVSESTPSLAFDTVGPGDHSLAVHITSAEEAEEAFTYEDLTGDAKREAQTFVDETDFETATLFYIETRAPNACHGLRVQSLAISDDDVLTGSVESRDLSAEDEECPAVVITPSRLVRVTAEPGLPSHAELDVTDGWGETERVTSDSLSDEDSKSR